MKWNSNQKKTSIDLLLLSLPDESETREVVSSPSFGNAVLLGFLKKKGLVNVESFNLYYVFHRFSFLCLLKKISKMYKLLNKDKSTYRLLKRKSLKAQIARGLLKTNKRVERKIYSLIKRTDPSAVGISVYFYGQAYYAVLVAKIIKTKYPGINIILGGPFIVKNIQYFILSQNENNFVDVYCVGNGEKTLETIIKGKGSKIDWARVPNIYYLENKSYKESFKKSVSRAEDLCILPDYVNFKKKGFWPLRISYGCYWGKCTFCTYCLTSNHYVSMSPNDATNIIKKTIEKWGVRKYSFVDDAITPFYLNEFSKDLLKNNISIQWTARLCVDTKILEGDTLEMMKKAGCVRVYLGVESMSDRILELMKKMHNSSEAKKLLCRFSEVGIPVSVFLLVGFPSETKEEASMSFDYLKDAQKDLSVDSIDVERFCLEGDTVLYGNYQCYGIRAIQVDDKTCGARLGYSYECLEGMSQSEIATFMSSRYDECKRYFKTVFTDYV